MGAKVERKKGTDSKDEKRKDRDAAEMRRAQNVSTSFS